MFRWQPEMQIDAGPIDEDHKKLISLANRILKMNTPDRDASELKMVIRELYEYVQVHFAREEAYMRSLGYPGLRDHRHKHQQIIKDMNHHLNSSYHLGQVLGSFRQLVSVWVIQHIMEEDRKIYQHIVDTET